MRLFWYFAVTCTVVSWVDNALAQRSPIADDTLGDERSIVTPEDNIRGLPGDRIEGGARRGDNLFHSFQEFNIDEGRAVYFDDPGVLNILSRVTGGTVSEIFGRLGVLGDANLFLINPSGIIFGEGARLDVSGSFIATTADAIQFGDQGFFSASNPNAPPLLTVQPSAFLFNQLQRGTIENRSIVSLGDDGLGNPVFGLLVPNGENLVLLGGNIVNSGNLNAFGGRVELGSVAGTGTVGLNADGSLSFSDGIARADVVINNGSRIDVASNTGGDITITARNINILDGSLLRSGIFSGLGTVDSQSGNIILNGTGVIQVGQSSLITNNVGANGTGDNGDITITAGSLLVTSGAQLQALTFGQGDAGDVIITATDRVVFDDGNAFSTVGSSDFEGVAVGEGGDVLITTGSLEVLNGAQLQASTFGQGDAGDVIITATDRVVFAGIGADGFASAAFSTVEPGAIGNGGNVEITTGSLEVISNASLQASTFGEGNAGSVIITADDRVVFDNGNALSTVEAINSQTTTVREGGDVRIRTGSLEVINDAELQAGTYGQGDAGNIIINADNQVLFDDSNAFSEVGTSGVGNGGNVEITAGSLEVINSAQLQADTDGQGNAGDVIINAEQVSIEGVGSDGRSSALFTSTFSRAQGQGGDITIDADSVRLADGAVINAETENGFRGGDVVINANTFEVTGGGQIITTTSSGGRAGNITLDVTDRITISGFDPNYDDRRNRFGSRVSNQGAVSGLFANTTATATNQGGTINITTGRLDVTNGAQLQALTFGQGDAGDVIITATDRVVFDDGNVFSTVEPGAIGNGGNVEITTGSLEVISSASLQASTFGEGNAGDVIIEATDRVVFDDGNAFSTVGSSDFEGVAVGEGGDVLITTGSLEVLNGAQLQASTFGQGNAGDVIINAEQVSIEGVGSDGRSSALFTSTFSRAQGRGGDITIDADSVRLTDGAIINAETENGFRGGNIRINANTFEVTGGGQIITTTSSGGRAGNITLDVTDRITISGFDPNYDDRRNRFGSRVSNQGAVSGLFANTTATATNQGGTINITTGRLDVTNGAQLQALTFGQGDAGDVIITATDRVVFDDSVAFSTVGTANVEGVAVGEGGDVIITTGSLEVLNGAQLQASTFGQGNAGDVIIEATDRAVFDDGNAFSRVERGAEGNGGNVELNTGSLEVLDGGALTASTFGRGSAGQIQINAEQVSIEGVGSDGRSSALFTATYQGAQGRGGDITIDADSVRLADGAVINAETENGFRGGNIRIDANTFEVTGGGQVITTTSRRGRAGNITLDVTDRITISGVDPNYDDRLSDFGESVISNQGAVSGLFANTAPNSSGSGGTIQITTGELNLSNRASIVANSQGNGEAGNIRIQASSFEITTNARLLANTEGEGNAGNVIINADTFDARNGGQVITTTADSGRAGNITLNVTDRITLSGNARQTTSGLFANTAEGSSGRGGTIQIRTGELEVFDRARIVVNSQGNGVAGDIDITAQSIELDRGRITAETNTVDGGNITLQDLDLLLLRNGGLISATAGTDRTAESVGDGGNITIDADFIVAFPNENSDIRANASEGNGGRVDITSEGLFGIEARDRPTEFSDITASSERGVQGDININTPDVDPSRGLTELPEDVVDASEQIAQTCPTDGNVDELGEFVVTGRGGLPADPAEILGGETVLTELADVEGDSNGDEENREAVEFDRPSTATNEQAEIVEAQGWVVGADGRVVLTADNSAVEPHSPAAVPVQCEGS